MFRRLITNLPYSPGLIKQVSFYSKRLAKEQVTRKYTFILAFVAIGIQVAYISAPPTSAIGCSTNDIVRCGGDQAMIVNAYESNLEANGNTDIVQIYNHFGIDKAALESASVVTINSVEANNYWSIGRHSRFSSDIEQQVPVSGASPVYMRPLHAWDTASSTNYSALQGTTNTGQQFWVLLNCGNIVIKGGVPTTAEPELDIQKSISSPAGTTVQPGDFIDYTINYRNVGPGTATYTEITDYLPFYTSFDSSSFYNYRLDANLVTWVFTNGTNNTTGVLGPTDYYGSLTVRVSVDSNAPDGAQICNSATINAQNADPATSSPVCLTVTAPPPPVAPPPTTTEETPPPAPTPESACVSLDVVAISDLKFKFDAVSSINNGASVSSYDFDFGDGSSESIDSSSTEASLEHIYAESGTYKAVLTVNTSEGSKTGTACEESFVVTKDEPTPDPAIACKELTLDELISRTEAKLTTQAEAINRATISSYTYDFGDGGSAQEIESTDENNMVIHNYDEPGQYLVTVEVKGSVPGGSNSSCQVNIDIEKPLGTPRISYGKRVKNVTQNIDDADGTVAEPGDVLEYTLITRNFGDAAASSFDFPKEYIADILEYADLKQMGGASFNEQKQWLSWKNQKISAGQRVIKTFRVKIMNPLPNLPVSTSDAGSYDLKLTNSYGDSQVEVDLPKTTAKTIERVAKRLPNTGLGSNIIVSTLLLGLSTYFYQRNRLLSKELKMIKKEYNG